MPWPLMTAVIACRVILETDPATIAGRVAMRGADNEIPLTEQVLACTLCMMAYAFVTESVPVSCGGLRLIVCLARRADAVASLCERQGAADQVAAEVKAREELWRQAVTAPQGG